MIASQMPLSDQWKEDAQNLELFMTYVKEALKFILFSFFKRCRIIIKILVKYQESRSTDVNPAIARANPDATRNRKETRESIIADNLAQNLKWAFLTISTCIEKSEAQAQGVTDNGNNDDTGEASGL